jgi:hypothetical protein
MICILSRLIGSWHHVEHSDNVLEQKMTVKSRKGNFKLGSGG